MSMFHNRFPHPMLQLPSLWSSPVTFNFVPMHLVLTQPEDTICRTLILSGGEKTLQVPQQLQAVHRHTVSSNIIEGDRAPESHPNRFPGNMYL